LVDDHNDILDDFREAGNLLDQALSDLDRIERERNAAISDLRRATEDLSVAQNALDRIHNCLAQALDVSMARDCSR
jgi:uncharacterized protein (DUF3084 family)